MSKKTKVHVVIQGHQPGVYRDWSDAQKQIHGFKEKVTLHAGKQPVDDDVPF
ncbi:TPA: RNase H1/viroplasmin domain-containing protein [Vibrio parahaemolyticus]|nr:RNase H1/viroplasmin domain-containing protein [Vibrio parahaemolyticus]